MGARRLAIPESYAPDTGRAARAVHPNRMLIGILAPDVGGKPPGVAANELTWDRCAPWQRGMRMRTGATLLTKCVYPNPAPQAIEYSEYGYGGQVAEYNMIHALLSKQYQAITDSN